MVERLLTVGQKKLLPLRSVRVVTAFHEAGHTMMAILLRVNWEWTWIARSKRDERLAGGCGITMTSGEQNPRDAHLIAVAGFVGEIIWCKRRQRGEDVFLDDFGPVGPQGDDLRRLADCQDRDNLMEEAMELLSRHEKALATIARHLTRNGILRKGELDFALKNDRPWTV